MSFHFNAALPTNTISTFELSSVTAESPLMTIYTRHDLGREYSILPLATHMLNTYKSVRVLVAVWKMGAVFHEIWILESKLMNSIAWISWCLTFSTNVRCYHTHRRWQVCLPARQCTQHSPTFRESYSSMNISCESTRSRNQVATSWSLAKKHAACKWNNAISGFPFSQGSVVSWGREIKQLLIA